MVAALARVRVSRVLANAATPGFRGVKHPDRQPQCRGNSLTGQNLIQRREWHIWQILRSLLLIFDRDPRNNLQIEGRQLT